MIDLCKILMRTEIQNLRSYLLDGTDNLDEGELKTTASYQKREEKGQEEVGRWLDHFVSDPEEKEKAYQAFLPVLVNTQNIYMELGLLAGARLCYELLFKNVGLDKEGRGEKSNRETEGE